MPKRLLSVKAWGYISGATGNLIPQCTHWDKKFIEDRKPDGGKVVEVIVTTVEEQEIL